MGKVYLVGAGPGDMKLITIKGLELIRQADMVALQSLELRRKAMEEEAKRPKKLGI